MARSRNIKPGFFKNEDLAKLEPHCRLLFAGLWCLADKVGRLEDRPDRVRGELFPYEPALEINRYLTELSRLNFIIRYQIGKVSYIQVTSWERHQRPHHTEKGSVIPPYIEGVTDITVTSPLEHGGNPPDSLIHRFSDSLIPKTSPSLRSGDSISEQLPPEELKKPRSTNTVNGQARKIPMPAEFAVSDAVRAWAAERGLGRLEEHLAAFRLKCAANGYRYVDWDAAFMEAVRKDWAGLGAQGGASGSNQAVVDEFLTARGLK